MTLELLQAFYLSLSTIGDLRLKTLARSETGENEKTYGQDLRSCPTGSLRTQETGENRFLVLSWYPTGRLRTLLTMKGI